MKSTNQIALILLLLTPMNQGSFAQSGIITTYVGPGYPVDGAVAITQAIDQPSSVALDGAGGFYVSSEFQNRVYRVTADGRLALVAGSRTAGFGGDGGKATSASLSGPKGIATDSAGNLFIADTLNNRIRKVTPGGIISTVAGIGPAGFGGDGGPATSAQLSGPVGITVDPGGNLYIADTSNSRIRKVTPAGIITTVAGSGTYGYSGDGGLAISAQVSYPNGVAVDTAGNLFIADTPIHRVRKVTPDGVIRTVAGNGAFGYAGDGRAATSAEMRFPSGLVIDSAGNLIISDTSNDRIRKVTTDGVINTIAGSGINGFFGDGGQATKAFLYRPLGLAVDTAGTLFIADSKNNRIRKVTPEGVISTAAGKAIRGFSGDGDLAAAALIDSPVGIWMDPEGNLLIADSLNERVRKVSTAGLINTIAGIYGFGSGGDGGPATSAELYYPCGVAADAEGNVFIADTNNQKIRKVTPVGLISTVAGNGTQGFSGDGGPAILASLNTPTAITVDGMGNLFIADTNNQRIRKVTPSGIMSTVAGDGTRGFAGDGGPAISAKLYNVYGLAVDSDGNLFLADSSNNRIRKIATNGVISTVAGNGAAGFSGDGDLATSAKVNSPTGIAVDPAGNLFIADTSNSRIRKVSTNGVMTTVAGNGTVGFSGDGESMTSAQLYGPRGVVVDSIGNLFIADTSNSRIRKVTLTNSPVINLTTSPAGLSFVVDGTTFTGTQSFSWIVGSTHTITIISPQGAGGTRYVFSNWSDGGAVSHTITVPASSTTYTANFTTQYKLNLYTSPLAGGSVASNPASSDGYYPSGMTVQLTAISNTGYLFTGWSGDLTGSTNPQSVSMTAFRAITANFSTPQRSSLDLILTTGGAARASTIGGTGPTQAGYAFVTLNSGTAPYGTAVFSYRQNGITVSEAGVPASPPTTSARLFVDYRTGTSVPGSAGNVDIYTGFAAVNRGIAAATITFTLRDLSGQTITSGNGTLAKDAHIAKFINQLPDLLSGFSIPPAFPTVTRFGTLELSSSQPLSIVALRLTTNQRGETLLTSTPIADLSHTPATGAIYFPQLADGGGYSTSVILMNTSDAAETGTLRLYANNGSPLGVRPLAGEPGSEFTYSIPPRGAYVIQTDASPQDARVGWIELTPGGGGSTPVAAGIFEYSSGGVLVTESGIPSTVPTTHVRVFVDTTDGHDTGFALGNPGNSALNVTLAAYPMGASTPAGTSLGPIPLGGKSHAAAFVDQQISGLPPGFRGVLDIASDSPFAALTLRSLVNERKDFLITTFPVADMTRPAPIPIIFPQLADGGGFVTEIILVSAGPACESTVSFRDDSGTPLQIGK